MNVIVKYVFLLNSCKTILFFQKLFKAHCDYMERTKILYENDRNDQLQNTNNISRSRFV